MFLKRTDEDNAFHQEKQINELLIENEQLDIYAAGKSIAAAKNELSRQFDHSYKRLNELNDTQLSPRILSAKEYFNFIIKTVSVK